jgi:hypothetical protein
VLLVAAVVHVHEGGLRRCSSENVAARGGCSRRTPVSAGQPEGADHRGQVVVIVVVVKQQ